LTNFEDYSDDNKELFDSYLQIHGKNGVEHFRQVIKMLEKKQEFEKCAYLQKIIDEYNNENK
jgi:hypothetical protein